MLIETQSLIKDFNGDPLKSTGDRDLTVGFACGHALLQNYAGEQLSFDEKVVRADLAEKFKEKDIELTAPQWETLKKCLSLCWAPSVIRAVNKAASFSEKK